MTTSPGKVGKSYPVGQVASSNSAPTAQASVTGERYGLIALILGIIALVLAVSVWFTIQNVAQDVENIRGLIENSAANATEAAVGAARSAERADMAERRSNISELYAKQVFVELNRLGYPVKTPAEEHSVAPVEEPSN